MPLNGARRLQRRRLSVSRSVESVCGVCVNNFGLISRWHFASTRVCVRVQLCIINCLQSYRVCSVTASVEGFERPHRRYRSLLADTFNDRRTSVAVCGVASTRIFHTERRVRRRPLTTLSPAADCMHLLYTTIELKKKLTPSRWIFTYGNIICSCILPGVDTQRDSYCAHMHKKRMATNYDE